MVIHGSIDGLGIYYVIYVILRVLGLPTWAGQVPDLGSLKLRILLGCITFSYTGSIMELEELFPLLMVVPVLGICIDDL